MVVMSLTVGLHGEHVHDFTDSPSMWTVHAPHDEVSQPMLVPVRPTTSRR